METLVIDRKRWGTGDKGGALQQPDTGKRCCLGFYCLQKGFSARNISGKGMPDALIDVYATEKAQAQSRDRLSVVLSKYSNKNNRITTLLAKVNDSKSREYQLHPERREKRITDLFAKLNVKVKFIN